MAVLEENVLAKPTGSAEQTLVERRGRERITMALPVRYQLVKEGHSRWQPSLTLDLSDSGIRLAIPFAVTVGSFLEIELQFPRNPKPMRLKGVVVWIAPSFSSGSTVCGIAFQDLKQVSRRDELVQFMADKFCQLALYSASKLVCSPANSLEELKSAYHLVYKEYRLRQYCAEHPSQMHYNHFCLLPDTRAFVLKTENQIFGTISLIVDSPCGLPIEGLFAREIDRLRAPSRRLAEVGLLALDLDAIGRGLFSLANFSKQVCLFHLFKAILDYARLAGGVTDLIIGMHPKHETLYRFMNFQTLAPARSYPGACGNPALLMRMDVPRTAEIFSSPNDQGRGAYFLSNPLPMELMRQHFVWTHDLVREFLVEQRPLFGKLSAVAQAYLKSCYPGLMTPDL